jgi:arginase family enzyme
MSLGGLTTQQLFPLLQAIDTSEGSEVIGGDVVEFNPERDPTYPVQTILGRAPAGPTAMVAAKVF